MGLKLNELAPALGAALAQVLVRLVVVVSRVKPHVLDLVFQQALKAVKCQFTVAYQSLVLLVN